MFDVALFYGGVEYTDRKSYLELGALMHEKGRDVSQPLEGLLLAHNGCQQEGHCSSTAIAYESSDDRDSDCLHACEAPRLDGIHNSFK